MPRFEVEVKRFSTSEVAIALKWGRIVDGEFRPSGPLYKKDELKPFYTIRRDGKYGKASYCELYQFNVPEDFQYAIAAQRRTGVGTTSIEMVYDVLFAPPNR